MRVEDRECGDKNTERFARERDVRDVVNIYIYIYIFDDLEAWTQCREGGREGGIEPVRNIQNPQNILLMPT